MRPFRLSNLIAIGVTILTLCSCINSAPGSSGNGTVSNKKPSATVYEDNNSNTSAATQQPTANMSPAVQKPVVNVYLETSGSMNGYVNGGTSIFQQVIKEYLSGINNANFASVINYYYINSKVIPKGNDLARYISNLTPQDFSAQGGTATTDIGGLFKTIMEAMDNNTISIFISDCIISPGRSNDPATYARGQMTDVRDAVVGYINKYRDLACMVYQFESGFKGSYYDYLNNSHKVDMQRPFYIWVFGHTMNIAKLKINYVPDSDFKIASIRNQWMIFNTPLSELQNQFNYGILLPVGTQDGKYTRKDATTVKGIQQFGNGLYRFSFGADLSVAQILMGDEYVEDTRNYCVIIDKARQESFYGSIENNYGSSPYTKNFRVDSNRQFTRGMFSLAFHPMIPDWVTTCSDDDDRSFDGVNDKKTYGLINIFNGIYNGYNNGNHNNIIAQFDFEIK